MHYREITERLTIKHGSPHCAKLDLLNGQPRTEALEDVHTEQRLSYTIRSNRTKPILTDRVHST